MNDFFQENKRALLILSGLLFIFAIVLYFIIIRPLMADLVSKENAIQSVEIEIQTLQIKLEDMNEEVTVNDVEQLILENKIPLKRDLDKYILSLQQLETITNSKINKISFMYDSNLEEIEVEEEPDATTDDTDGLDELEVSEKLTIDPVILSEKPENLQVMTVRVEGVTPSFEEFISLLEAIENQDRISIVSKLTFAQPNEEDMFFTENEITAISFEAELSTFYYKE